MWLEKTLILIRYLRYNRHLYLNQDRINTIFFIKTGFRYQPSSVVFRRIRNRKALLDMRTKRK